jgi:hypothetical protein
VANLIVVVVVGAQVAVVDDPIAVVFDGVA